MRRYLTLSLLLSALALNACGMRGSLYLPPPQPVKTPASPTPAPANPDAAKPSAS
ncbi:MAG: lipoprotein [Candidatus Accumulibacter sp.]|nr:lipoprotein [Accumulibacter sp.]